MTIETPPELPSVLVVTHIPFNNSNNAGITVSNLFRGWPKSRLANVYIPFGVRMPPAFDVCESFWALHYNPLRAGPLRKSSVPADDGYRSHLARRIDVYRKRLVEGTKASRIYPAAALLREALYHSPTVTSPSLFRWIEARRPQVLYSTLGSIHIMKLVLDISRKLDLPIVPHCTDDSVATGYKRAMFVKQLRRLSDRRIREVLARSPVRMVISKHMALAYRERYGGAYEVFINTVEIGAYQQEVRDGARERVRIVYTGGLQLNRWQSLLQIGQALKELDREGIRGELLIYTSPEGVQIYGERLKLEPVMRVVGNLTNAEVPAALLDADILLHVESFDPAVARYTRLSMSTKIPEYLLAGRPLLAYGPASLASVAIVAEERIGRSVSDQNEAALKDSLRELMGDKALRDELGARARQLGLTDFEASTTRKRFRAALARAAS